MPFSDEELLDIVQEIRKDPNYFTNTDAIINRCTFRHVDARHFDDTAVDSLTERELHFSMIGRIIRKTTFLQPEGLFRPSGILPISREEQTAFLNSKLKASLAPPKGVLDARTAKDDWARFQTTLKRLVNSAVVQAGNTQHWSPYRKDRDVFLMSHPLISWKGVQSEEDEKAHGNSSEPATGKMRFTPGPSGEVDNDPIDVAEGVGLPEDERNLEQHIDKLMSIKEWPACPEWHAVADRFKDTHLINPLHAFDDEYELIMPKSYEARLLGAVVHARFTLNRFEIRGDFVFVCNIVELQVLKPPPGGTGVRKKRALMNLIIHKRRKKRRLA